MPSRTFDLLNELMAGHELSVDELDALLNDKVREDLFLEYKHGDEIKDSRKGAATIRQSLSGFANSEGGVLIIGVDENSWSVTGCAAPGGGSLTEWAARCLTPIATRFAPPPRFHTITYPGGSTVLVAATSRSLGIVPCIEGQELIHYLRFHDQTLNNKTLRAPDYLMRDLILGRRQQAYISISNVTASAATFRPDGAYALRFDIIVIVSNDSLVWADEVMLGVIACQYAASPGKGDSITDYLASQIELRPPIAPPFSEHYRVSHVHGTKKGFTPFTTSRFSEGLGYEAPIQIGQVWHMHRWQAAVYAVAKGSPPMWFQFELLVNQELLVGLSERGGTWVPAKFVTLRPCVSDRPVVAWQPL